MSKRQNHKNNYTDSISLMLGFTPIGAIHWLDEGNILLADTGISDGRWYLYQIQLEGEWRVLGNE